MSAPIDFSAMLTTEQKRELLTQRISAYSAEGYQHMLNKQMGEANGDAELVAQSDASIAILSDAILLHQTELAALPTE